MTFIFHTYSVDFRLMHTSPELMDDITKYTFELSEHEASVTILRDLLTEVYPSYVTVADKDINMNCAVSETSIVQDENIELVVDDERFAKSVYSNSADSGLNIDNIFRLDSNNKYMAILCLQRGLNISSVPNHMLNDRDVVLQIMNRWCIESREVFVDSSDVMKDDYSIAMAAITMDPLLFKHTSERLRDDIAFVIHVAHESIINGTYVKMDSVSDRLRDEDNIVSEYIKVCASNMLYASDRLRDDKEFILDMMRINPGVYVYASDKIRNDLEILIRALRYSPGLILKESEEVRNNPKIVTIALSGNFKIISKLRTNLKDDSDFMYNLIKSRPSMFRYASDRLRRDRDFILRAVDRDCEIVKYMDESSLDEDMSWRIISRNSNTMRYLPNAIKSKWTKKYGSKSCCVVA